MPALPELRLKKNEDRRLRAGHLWVYSNEVDTKQTPLKEFEVGQWCHVTNSRGRVLGTAYINPNTLICARLVSRFEKQILSKQKLIQRIQEALRLRERVFSVPCYRLIFGESDALPGLVVDRFYDVLVVQVTTAGMDCIQNDIIEALSEVIQPKTILLRNDSGSRQLEGLEIYSKTVLGELPGLVELEENGTRFVTSLEQGQKTGWFYDHRLNRQRTQHYVKDKRVLDVFSYVGGWGVEALQAGAKDVTCIDASAFALDLATQSAALNKLEKNFSTLEGDAFEVLKSLADAGETYDVVILDPPAFVKRRKDLKEGSLAYRRINRLAMNLIKNEGILVSASCSYHLGQEQLLNEIRQASYLANVDCQVLEQGHQGPDHPVHPAMKETDYLKSFICHIKK
ncbi:MAG: class I SAM-dependent rRNA methyltransferase [Gammaproteobacteria bacterium]|nr:class I SAM-dependent rRNA methyltransferase [Gammaproteobacteria bacterium]MCW8988532.1 class I SAM-dependent rRNA methyltransferase [Gammaproteobacteria bacterium]